VANTKPHNQRVDGSKLQSAAPTLIAQLGRGDVIISIRRQQG